MPHAFDVRRRVRDTRRQPFKKCIIAAWARGKITPVRYVLESIQKREAFHVLNNSQKKPGRVRVLMRLSLEGSGWTPT